MITIDYLEQILAAVIISAGGVGGIILAILKVSANIITDRMNQKIQKEFEKEVEKYKTELETKQYVSISRFDKEFSLYQNLNEAFFELIKDINRIIPMGISYEPVDKNLSKKLKENAFKDSLTSCEKAQDLLMKNEPFIFESIYTNYSQILQLCRTQIFIVRQKYNALNMNPDKGTPKLEDYARTKEIFEAFEKNNKEIKLYLSSLELLG